MWGYSRIAAGPETRPPTGFRDRQQPAGYRSAGRASGTMPAVLINRGVERLRRRGVVHAELARRARVEVPLVVVPPAFGVRLRDERGRIVWGATRRLFAGRSFTEVPSARPAGLLDGFRLLP